MLAEPLIVKDWALLLVSIALAETVTAVPLVTSANPPAAGCVNTPQVAVVNVPDAPEM